jgi:hypothetical protein
MILASVTGVLTAKALVAILPIASGVERTRNIGGKATAIGARGWPPVYLKPPSQ